MQGKEKENHLRVTLGTQGHASRSTPSDLAYSRTRSHGIRRDMNTYYDLANLIKSDAMLSREACRDEEQSLGTRRQILRVALPADFMKRMGYFEGL